jgi:hypothetical protein
MQSTNFNGKVFFYCVPPDTPEKTGYPHTMICLGDGLKALGIEFYANIDFWQLAPDKNEYLFRHDPNITPDDCSIVVLNQDWFRVADRPFPQHLFHKSRKYVTVYMDSDDGAKTHAYNPEFRQFDFIFKLCQNRYFKYPDNFYPWTQGVSHRMLREVETIPDFSERKQQLLVNFREPHKIKHSVRRIVRKEFLPKIQSVIPIDNIIEGTDNFSTDPYHYLQWSQTGRRHSPGYYQSLKDRAACACFGGFFVTPFPQDPSTKLSRVLKNALSKLEWKSNRIADWDNWRFWESSAAGCVSIREDFDKYGFVIPVMPENWRHYIGVDLDNIQSAVDKIADEPEILEKISTEGRQWVLENYSPAPVALRFLNIISQKLSD